MPPGNGCDHAVDQAHGSDARLPAPAVDAYGSVEVSSRIELVQMEPQRQTAQIGRASIAAGPGQYFHDHRFGDGDRAVGGDEFGEAPVGCVWTTH